MTRRRPADRARAAVNSNTVCRDRPERGLTATARQRAVTRTTKPVVEVVVEGAPRHFQFRFAASSAQDPNWNRVYIDVREPHPRTARPHWRRTAGIIVDSRLAFPLTTATVSDTVLTSCCDFALDLAVQPLPSAPPVKRLVRGVNEMHLVFVPKCRDEVEANTDVVEIALDRAGTLRVREWQPWYQVQIGDCCSFDLPRWSPWIIAATGLDARDLFQRKAPSRHLIELFWAHANAMLRDPFLRDDDDPWFGERETEWMRGSEDELIRLLRIFAWTEPQTGVALPYEIRIKGDTDKSPMALSAYHGQSFSPRFKRLVELALKDHRMVGWHTDYNDGNGNRRSGFSHYAEGVTLQVDAPSMHERLEAFAELADWLRPRVDATEYERLLSS